MDKTNQINKFEKAKPGTLWCYIPQNKLSPDFGEVLFCLDKNGSPNRLSDYNFNTLDRAYSILKLGEVRQVASSTSDLLYIEPLYKVMTTIKTRELKIGWISALIIQRLKEVYVR